MRDRRGLMWGSRMKLGRTDGTDGDAYDYVGYDE